MGVFNTKSAATVVSHIANQLGIPSKAFSNYNFRGRSIDEHRTRIRQWFGFRPYAEADRRALIDWLCEAVLSENQNKVQLKNTKRNRISLTPLSAQPEPRNLSELKGRPPALLMPKSLGLGTRTFLPNGMFVTMEEG